MRFHNLNLTLPFKRCEGHHNIERKQETNTTDQGLEKLDSVKEFKTFNNSLKYIAQRNKFLRTFTKV